jgi:uncharacterized protein YoxC
LQFAEEKDTVYLSAGPGVGLGDRSKSSGNFTGGSGTSSVGGSVQQELSDVEGMSRSKSDYALQRGKSKKEMKTEKTTKFYKDLTDALHSRVADFMVGVNTEDDEEDEMEELKKDLTTTIQALQEALMSEVQHREQGEAIMREQFERQEANINALRVAQDRLNEMQNFVGKVNEHVEYLESSVVEKISRDVETIKIQELDRLNREVQSLQNSFESTVEKLSRDVEFVKSGKIQELDRQCNDLVNHVHHLMDGHGQLENKLEGTLRNYSNELDGKLGHHAAKLEDHTKDLNMIQRDLTRIDAEVENRHSSFVKTLDESMNQALGKLHQDVMAANSGGANTAKDLAALRSEVEELPRKALSGLAPQIDEVRMSVNSLQQEFGTRERDSQRSMQALLDNVGNNMTQNVGKLDKRCSDMGELIDRQAADGERFRLAAQDCFDRMDKRFTNLDDVCNGQAGDLRTLAESSAEMGAGLSQLKSSIGRLANNTASELQTTRDEIEQICNSLCSVSKSWGSSNIRSQRMSRSMMSAESRSMDIRTAGG